MGNGVGGVVCFVGVGVGGGGEIGEGTGGEGVGRSDEVVGPIIIGGVVTKSSSTRLILSSDTLLSSTHPKLALAPRLLTPQMHRG